MLRKLSHFNKRTSTEKTKKLGILVCVCMMILAMGALVGCSGTDENTDTAYESSNEMDIDVTIGSGETEDSSDTE